MSESAATVSNTPPGNAVMLPQKTARLVVEKLCGATGNEFARRQKSKMYRQLTHDELVPLMAAYCGIERARYEDIVATDLQIDAASEIRISEWTQNDRFDLLIRGCRTYGLPN